MAQTSAQPTPASAPPVAAKPPARPCEVRRFKLVCSSASDVGNHFAIVAPSGVDIETILLPEWYSSIAGQLRVADTIDVHADDRSFYAKLYVRDVGRARVSVALLHHVEFDALATTSELAAHRVSYQGPHSRWCIQRISDGKLIREGCETKEEATTALTGIERALDKKVAA
jgi:hypothetical protein